MYSTFTKDLMKARLYHHAHKAYQDVLLCNKNVLLALSPRQDKELRELIYLFFGLPMSHIVGSNFSNTRTNSHEFAAVIHLEEDEISLDDLDMEFLENGEIFDDDFVLPPSALNDALTVSSSQQHTDYEKDVWDEIMTPRNTAYMSSVPSVGLEPHLDK